MPDVAVHNTEVDGVPTFWVAGDGPLQASLWFRAGVVDEALPTHGWLHLLEHLALHDRSTIKAPVNGQVDLLHTAFAVEGEPDEVTDFLHDVCDWLSDPRFDRLDHERRILRAEGQQRYSGPVAAHLLWRFGAQGPGLAAYDEFGLHNANPDGLRNLAARVFARGNAALALTGSPPSGLRLPLAEGPRIPPPIAVPCQQPTPGAFLDQPRVVALSGAVARSSAALALVSALQRAIERTVRHDAGLGYSAWSSYETVDVDHAMATVGIDILPEALPTIAARCHAVIRRLRDHGPEPTELRDDIDRQIQHTVKMAPEVEPIRETRALLMEYPRKSRDDLIAELRTLTVDDVRRAADELWDGLLMSLDPECTVDNRVPLLSATATEAPATTGRKFKSVTHPVVQRTLVVGNTGAAYDGDGVHLTATYDDLAALLAYADGGRRLVRRDGYQIPVEPTLLNRGREAVKLLDSTAPAGLYVWLPPRPPEEVPRSNLPVRQLLGYWFFRPWLPLPLFLAGVITVFLAVEQIVWYHIPAILIGSAAYLTIRRLTRSEK